MHAVAVVDCPCSIPMLPRVPYSRPRPGESVLLGVLFIREAINQFIVLLLSGSRRSTARMFPRRLQWCSHEG